MVKRKLERITQKGVKDIIIDTDALHYIEKTKEPSFVIKEIRAKEDKITDHLIRVEIAFRECDRFGVFE